MYFQKMKNLDGSVGGDCVECTECGKSIKTKRETPLSFTEPIKNQISPMLRRKQKKKSY